MNLCDGTHWYGSFVYPADVEETAPTEPANSIAECCERCQATTNCLAGSYMGDGECTLIIQTATHSGPASDTCPLGQSTAQSLSNPANPEDDTGLFPGPCYPSA